MARKTPLISVVVPVLNAYSTISGCLTSIVSQHVPAEILLIDGGSTDGTLKIIQRYEQHLSYFESGHDQGIADAFNRGIKQAKGEYIAILNSDDMWTPDTLELVLKHRLLDPEADIYHGSIRYLLDEGQSYVLHPKIENLRWRMNVFHPTLFVKKKTYEQVGLYDERYRYAMDSEWCHRALVAGMKFSEVNALLAQMRLGGRSDEHWVRSLNEYRRSVTEHRLLNWGTAAAAFTFLSLAKGTRRLFSRYTPRVHQIK